MITGELTVTSLNYHTQQILTVIYPTGFPVLPLSLSLFYFRPPY